MCGINGIYGLNDIERSKTLIAQMNRSLSHRGPDDEGVYTDENIALGHRRLSIIDLSSAGHQPMFSHDKRYSIVYNGELYNYQEIKNQIKEYPYTTNTDTEVILAAYTKWGKDCLQYFNGMYAFAIWDIAEKKLFIARDRLGIKPLYYSPKDNQLIFSSEIRSLLSTDLVPRKLDENNLIDYLRYQTVHSPNTIIKDIFMLMPGHYMEIRNAELGIHDYWSLSENISNESNGKSYEEICKDVNNLLYKAVERRLIADVPFGAFLSGGIDSSAIVGLMSKISKGKVKTFSIVFDDKKFNEAEYSRLIAKKFDTEHHEIKLGVSDFRDQLPEALKAMDHPSGDGPNTYIVSKATKNSGITMALSGLGGDELFCGYDVFKRSYKIEKQKWLNRIPLSIRKLSGEFVKNIKPRIPSEKLAELMKLPSLNFESAYPLFRQVLLDDQIKNIISAKELSNNVVSQIIHSSPIIGHSSFLSQVSIAEISTYMQNVLLRDTDQMSMAHALEVRVPFMDYQLVEYVLGIPDKHKYPSTPKKLLIDSLSDLLPSEIINRPKMGFTFPWKYWMKNELKSFCESKIISLSKRNYFDEKNLIALWNSFLKDDPRIIWSRIWYLVVLENWLIENNIE